ncbi:MAG: NB-ARC domain-containing protein [Ardenticatenaceae bacterium]
MTLEPQKLDDLINRKSVHRALKAWKDLNKVGQPPLAQLKIVASQRKAAAYADTPLGHGQALREVLKEAIETLKPSETKPENLTKRWRPYFLLTERFIDGRSPGYIQGYLAIGQGTYYIEQRRGLDRVADTLRVWEEEQNAQDEGPRSQSLPKEPLVRLPDKPYRQLRGREERIKQIIEGLRDTDGPSIVGIDGMGGIGKTALAYEVTERCFEEDYFEAAVWISASRGPSTSSGTVASWEQASGALTFESILDTIGQQLGVPDIAKFKLAQKKARVQALLAKVGTLVVLDNLETAYEPQNEIARQLQPLLASSRSKALLTSRYRFRGDLYVIHLSGLHESSVLPLIQQIAEEKGIHHVATATLRNGD